MILDTLDWLLLAVLILAAINGFRKGLIKSIGGVFSLVVGIWCAVQWWQPITQYLEKNYSVVTTLSVSIAKHIPFPVLDDTGGLVPLLFKSSLYAYQGMPYHISRVLVSAAVFLLTVSIIAGLTMAIWHILSVVFEWGILGMVNRVGGVAFEVSKVVLVLTILVGVLNPVMQAAARAKLEWAILAMEYMDSSVLVPYLESLFAFMGTII
ncbi:MAG: CvpA family protein [Chitinophagales bacterium]